MAVVPFSKEQPKRKFALIEPEHWARAAGGAAPKLEDDEPDEAPIRISSTSEAQDGSLEITYGESKEPDEDSAPDDDFDRNLAEKMDDFDLGPLASRLLQEIENDVHSRQPWEETANVTADYLGIKLEDPSTSVSVDGTVSKMVATCMLEAAMKMWGVSYAELLPVSGPVKVRDDKTPKPSQKEETDAGAAASGTGGIGNASSASPQPPTGGIADAAQADPSQETIDSDDLGRALEIDMNHYLTAVDQPYYDDTSQALMHRNLIGLMFKKVYRCPLLRRPVSRWVKAQNFIINNNISHLSENGRRTERIPTSQATMRRLMVAGHYRDIALVQPQARATATEMAVEAAEGIAAVSQLPEDFEHTVYECYTEIGSSASSSMIGSSSILDKDEDGKKPGYPLPYRVSIDLDSAKILEIRRDWKKGDKDHRARRRYIKFGLIPGLGYYNWGLIHIVGNPTQAATMIQRAMVDSSLFANFPGGVYFDQTGQKNTVFRQSPGEWAPMRQGSMQRIQDMFMPMPYRPPTPEMMALVEKFEADVKRLSSVMEIPVGEGRLGNTPVGTIMSYIESISQVPGAVHKSDHRAQQEEFSLLRELFAEDPESLVRGVKSPARKWQEADELMAPNLVPAADPNTPSEIHRLLKVQGLVTAAGLPQFQGIADQKAVWKLTVAALTGSGEGFTMPPQDPGPMPPDPKIAAATIKAQSDQEKVQAQQQTEDQKHQERMVELQQEDQQREADRQSAETRAAMSLQAARLKVEGEAANAAADRQHEALQQHADRQQADTHKQADIQHQTLTAGLTAADNEADRQHQTQQAAQKPPAGEQE